MSEADTKPAEPRVGTNQIWEYQVLNQTNADDWVIGANTLGAQGWELVSLVFGYYYVGVFKRSKGPAGP